MLRKRQKICPEKVEMELHCEAAAGALSGSEAPAQSQFKPSTRDKAGDFLASPCSSPHLPTEKLFCFGVSVVGHTEENSDSLLFGFT